MSADIQLRNIKYCGDTPEVADAYLNVAYSKDISDAESDNSLKKRQIQENDKVSGMCLAYIHTYTYTQVCTVHAQTCK